MALKWNAVTGATGYELEIDGTVVAATGLTYSHLPTHMGISRAKPIQLLLIDDIYTTGSTLDACGRVILNAGFHMEIPVEIYTLTLARS